MALTLAQLLAAPTSDDIRARIFGALAVAGFPITDYASGSVARTILEAVAVALDDYAGSLVPLIAGGGYLEHASGEWLTLLVSQNYAIERATATHTVQTIKLADSANSGPHSFLAGDLVVESTAGRRYSNTTGGTITLGGSLSVPFRAESPGAAYADPPGSITKLVTSLPGVTVTNTAPGFSPVAHAGPGSGSVTPGLQGTPAVYTIRIVSSGQAGAATYYYSKDGAAFTSPALVPAGSTTLVGGTSVTFANGGTSPSFIEGDAYIFSTPGSPVVTQGIDDESDASLRARARARWPSLANVPTSEAYELWARTAAADVTKVLVRPSNTTLTPGQIDITIAGAVNPLSGAVVATVQAYVDARAPITDVPIVTAATAITITASGKVVTTFANAATVKAAAQAAWNSHIAALPLGGVVRAAELVQALMDAGAVDVGFSGSDQILVGPSGALAASYQLGSTAVAVASGTPLSSLLTWVAV